MKGQSVREGERKEERIRLREAELTRYCIKASHLINGRTYTHVQVQQCAHTLWKVVE